MCCLLDGGPLFIFILHSFRRDRKLSDIVQVHLDLSGALPFSGADGSVNDDLLHKGKDHIVCYFCTVPIFTGKGKVFISLLGGGLHFIQPSLIFCKFSFQRGFLLLILRRQLVEAFLRNMPKGIVFV